MTLSTRVTFAMVAVTILTAAAGGVFTYFNLESRLRPVMLGQLADRSGQLTNAIDATIRAAQADVLAIIASQPLQGLTGALLTEGVDPVHGIDAEQWRERLAIGFAAHLGAKPDYHQIRYIGMANGGRELVRVDRMGENEAVQIVAEEQLAIKGDRDYFQKAIGLGRGQIYLGTVELNQEHGKISVPRVPVLRVASPVLLENGGPFGIVIINLDLRRTFALIRSLTENRGETYVVNRAGDYLLHPDPSMEFGFALGEPHRLQDGFPDILNLMPRNQPGAHLVKDASGQMVALAVAPVGPQGADIMTVVQVEPYDALMMPLASVEASTFLAGLTSAVVAVILSIAVSRSLTRPFRQIALQLEGLGLGQPRPALARGPSEILHLSATLEAMSTEIQSRTQALEDEIAVRCQAEAALNEYVDKMRLFSAVVESSDDAILSMTLDGIITSWNPAAEHLYGYAQHEALGSSINLIVPSDRAEESEGLMKRIAAGERVASVQTVWRHKDGHNVDISLTISPIEMASGQISGASAIARDISRGLQAEEKFRLVVESSPNGIVMVDGAGIVQLVNRETERLFGYGREELIGQSMEILVPARFRAEHPRKRGEFHAEPSGRPMGEGRDLYGQRNDGTEFPIEVGLNPIHTRQGMMVLSVVVDITERKKAEANIQRHTEDLRRSNRELETFAYAASHDLQEPLRMVASYVELLAKRYEGKLDEKADKYIYYAVDGATRMKQLINDLLAYSRVSTQGKVLEPTDSGVVLAQIMRGLEGLVAEAEAEVTWDELPMVLADPIQLGQVLQNLVANGLKFRGEAPPRIHIDAVPLDGMWELRVRDNGIGIDSRFSDRVFHMFQRLNTREEYPGTGIGLAIAQKIVERHGGRIWFTSEIGQGTTFHFTIKPTW